MKADIIDRLAGYFTGERGSAILKFIKMLRPEIASGEYPIMGRDVYAIVSRYETKSRDSAYPEAHRVYTDIQLLLSGAEAIEWFPLEGLSVRTPYNDEEKDIEFYERPDAISGLTVLRPGVFVIYEPTDAHMPQLKTRGAGPEVTKVVIKVKQ